MLISKLSIPAMSGKCKFFRSIMTLVGNFNLLYITLAIYTLVDDEFLDAFKRIVSDDVL